MTIEGPTPEQLALLVDAISEQSSAVSDLRAEIGGQSDALREAKRLTRDASKLARRAITIGAIAVTVGVIAVVIAALAVGQSWRTNDKLDQAETQRQERAVASCEQANDFYEKHN